jgi:hypothetical protein
MELTGILPGTDIGRRLLLAPVLLILFFEDPVTGPNARRRFVVRAGRRAIVAGRNVSLEGLVVAADWDENDEVTLVSLLTDDEGEYLVEADSIGRELIGCIHKRVRLHGCLGKDQSGEDVIAGEYFTILDPPEGKDS